MNNPASKIHIFDHLVVRQNQHRVLPECCILKDEIIKRLQDRFEDVRRDFKNVLTLDVSDQTVLDKETLPFEPASFDAVVCPLNLHWINDLPGVLLQIRQILKPDGLFLGAMFGGGTLTELSQVLMEAELKITGGASPHVSPFVDIRDMGALMQRASFSLPVVDRDTIWVSYPDMFRLMHDLRGMGEGNALIKRSKNFMRRDVMMEAAKLYQTKFSDGDGGISARFDVIYLTGWHPHPDQQKPLKPGQGQTSLEEVFSK